MNLPLLCINRLRLRAQTGHCHIAEKSLIEQGSGWLKGTPDVEIRFALASELLVHHREIVYTNFECIAS